jgi:hypothetical protein
MSKSNDQIVANGRTAKSRVDAFKGAGEALPKKPGRKPGKHSNENYTQTSIYLPIELRNRVRARLYERGMEMSGLVEEMLREWIENQEGDASLKGRSAFGAKKP